MICVLIVDDLPATVEQFSAILLKHGFKIISTNNGSDAIEVAKTQKPDVILMDIVLPGDINGFQATRLLSKDPITKNIPIIVVTNKDLETDRIWAERQGAKQYLMKPVNASDLVNAINQVLKK